VHKQEDRSSNLKTSSVSQQTETKELRACIDKLQQKYLNLEKEIVSLKEEVSFLEIQRGNNAEIRRSKDCGLSHSQLKINTRKGRF